MVKFSPPLFTVAASSSSYPVLNVIIQRSNVPDHADLHVIFRRRLETGLHIVAQQRHERRHLALSGRLQFSVENA